jgi:hypothetical protein
MTHNPLTNCYVIVISWRTVNISSCMLKISEYATSAVNQQNKNRESTLNVHFKIIL